MIWHGDPKYQGIMAEERWARAFEAAANRRLLDGTGRRSIFSEAVQRAQSYLEQTFYLVVGRKPSPVSTTAEEPALPDAEMVRLLALLAPDGRVLHVERVRRIAEGAGDGDHLEVVGECRQ